MGSPIDWVNYLVEWRPEWESGPMPGLEKLIGGIYMEGQMDWREEFSEVEWARRLAEHMGQGGYPRLKHWGVWHPNKGWWFEAGGKLFFTMHRSVAEAQRDVVQHWGGVPEGKELYRVRCIEEWADEQQIAG